MNSGGYGIQGRRKEMEDEHVIMNFPPEKCRVILFAAVFDGHCGNASAKYCAKKLFPTLVENQKKIVADSSNMDEYIKQSCFQLDNRLRKHLDGDFSGTCACFVMVTENEYIISNIGDSRYLLCRNGAIEFATVDHKPILESEYDRIKKAGGFVFMGRVNGDLAVARSFGDFRFKDSFDLEHSAQKITCEPTVTVIKRNEHDEFIILACDGFWDVFSNEDAVKHVKELQKYFGNNAKIISEKLTQFAYEKGSMDNVTVVVILFE